MADFRQGIGLIHELRELTAAEEFFHGGDDRANIDEGVGRGLSRLLYAHALFDDALHTQEADAELALDKLADAAHAAIAQVVNVVFAAMAVVQLDKAANDVDEIILG